MKFLFPTFLFALFTLAIPVLIHLFNFRRYKTVFFSNVGYLKQIKKESKKKARLKQILLLIARILALTFLIFAFSQPYIPENRDAQKQANQMVAIYIDNSFSMNALSEQGQLLQMARNKAVEICLAYPANTVFRLYTNDLQIKHQNNLNKEQLIQQIAEIQTSPTVLPISLVYNRFAALQNDQENKTDKVLYFISDFQRKITDMENFSKDPVFSYYLLLVPNQVSNLYIDSCWVEIPAHRLNQEEEVFVKIKNSSDQSYNNLPLKLYLNDSIKSITNFSVSAQNEITANLKYTNNSSGSQLGKIEITDYPFTHDNDWYISYFVESNLNALVVYSDKPSSKEGLAYISALFENDEFIRLDKMNVNNLQVSKLNDYNTIFLMNLEDFSSGFLNELRVAVEQGTSLVMFPGNKNNPDSNNKLLATFNANQISGIDTTKQKISGTDFENDFYKDVFKKKEDNPVLPEIDGHFRFTENTRSAENRLLWFQNNDKALSKIDFQKGKFWSFAFSLEKRNESFARDVLFVPTLYNIVLTSLPEQDISYIVGQNTFFDLALNQKINLNSSIEIALLGKGTKFIPEKSNINRGIRLNFPEQIKEAGHYLVENDNLVVATMAFNNDRKESDFRFFNSDELEEKLDLLQLKNASVIKNVESNFSEIFDEIENGKQLWKLCILLSLVFITSEVLISRFWK